MRLVLISCGDGAPPFDNMFEIALGRVIFESIRLIGKHGNESVGQAIIDLAVKAGQHIRSQVIFDTDAHMLDAGFYKIDDRLGLVIGAAFAGLGPVHIHTMPEHALILRGCDGFILRLEGRGRRSSRGIGYGLRYHGRERQSGSSEHAQRRQA